MDLENRKQLEEKFQHLLEGDLLQECTCRRLFCYVWLPHSRFAGVDLCRNYNISGEDFFWKWEANNLRFGGSSVERMVTKDSINSVREQLQEDAKKAKKQAQAQAASAQRGANLRGPMSRNLFGLGSMGLKAEPKDQKLFASSSSLDVPEAKWKTAGPSTVAVTYPHLEKSSSKASKCESFAFTACRSADTAQTGTCTRRSQNAAKLWTTG